jgi:hypothetical protein
VGGLKAAIAQANKVDFGGKAVLKMSNDIKFELDYSGCYYEGDTPGIKAIVPYTKPKIKKKGK